MTLVRSVSAAAMTAAGAFGFPLVAVWLSGRESAAVFLLTDTAGAADSAGGIVTGETSAGASAAETEPRTVNGRDVEQPASSPADTAQAAAQAVASRRGVEIGVIHDLQCFRPMSGRTSAA